ncbi:MAG: hypothetical protein Q9186_001468 [Xanthomendoza sp. 1 TL-2023]
MESSKGETYMLLRNNQESQRLDDQHQYMRAMCHGHLFHPSIPINQLDAVADVATGTGVWLQQLSHHFALSRPAEQKDSALVGFDISAQQFPPAESIPPHVNLVVHDMVETFPVEYHEKFDMVNVRLVSYAIKAAHLDKVVRNVIQLLRPGGYLQWQETDASDSWAHPETATATSCVNYVIAEKMDRGLLPGIAGPLVKSIVSIPATLADGQKNPISWSEDLMRLIHLETVSTLNHPSPVVEAGKKAAVMSAATALLMARISRKSTELEILAETGNEEDGLRQEIESMNEILEAVRSHENTHSSWDFDLTWIVARKAIGTNVTEGWMSIKKPNL